MRRFLLGLVFLFCTNAVLLQATTFPSFLLKLKEIEKIDIHAFGDRVIEPNLSDESLKPYLFQLSARLNISNDSIWQGGGYMRKGDVICVFLQVHLLDYHDEYSKWFMESLLTKYVVATYTKEGKLLDCQCVGQGDGMYRFAIDGTKGDSFYVLQSVLDAPYMVHDYNGEDYMVRKSKVTIGSNGEIRTRQLSEYKQHIQDEDLKLNPPLAFGDFLKKFRQWDKEILGDSLFVYSPEADSFLASSLLLTLFPKEEFCERCWPKDLSWTPCFYVETPDLYLCSMVMECVFPKKKESLYTDRIIAVFDKKGKFRKLMNVGHWQNGVWVSKLNDKELQRLIKNSLFQ